MPPDVASGLPWENRQRLGFLEALLETAKLFITDPAEAWRRTPANGNIGDPLVYAILISWIGIVFWSLYSMIFHVPLWFMPEAARSRLPMEWRHGGGSFLAMLFAPLLVAVGVFLWSAILHLCLMLVGGSSSAGFDATFRVVAYSQVADLAHVIPFVGGLIALVWKIALATMGLATLHRTTQGKALAAVLIPLVLCCGCFVAGLLGMGVLAAIFHRGH